MREKIIEKINKELEIIFKGLSRNILSQIDYYIKRSNKDTLEGKLEEALIKLRIPTHTPVIEVKKQLQSAFQELYGVNGSLISQESLENIIALSSIELPDFKKEYGTVLSKTIKTGLQKGLGYSQIRRDLKDTGKPEYQISTIVNTSIAQFDNKLTIENAAQSNIKKFKYDGALHPNTRNFCRKHLGKIYTLDQIRQLDNGQGLPVETSLGGYNCTHYWTPVAEFE